MRHHRTRSQPDALDLLRLGWLLCWVASLSSLEHTIFHRRPLLDAAVRQVEFDASPWGGGALLIDDGVPSEYFVVEWIAEMASTFGAVTGLPEWQTFWEFATLAC